MSNIKKELGKLKAFVFDVDGVFSEDKVYLHPSGDMMRTMNVKDGYAIQHAVKLGYPVCIITGGSSESVKIRFQELGVTDIYLKAFSKIDCFNDFISKYDIKPEEVLYMGDDLPDYETMSAVGFPVCPLDAVEEIKSISKYISDKNGGSGCVRDVIEQVMRVKGQWISKQSFIW